MNNRMIKFLCVVLAVASAGGTAAELGSMGSSSSFDRLPGYYPSYFPRAGILRSVNNNGRTMLVDATWHAVAIGVDVYTPISNGSALGLIRPGSHIGFVTERSQEGRWEVTKIWKLPAGTVKDDGDRLGLGIIK